MTRQEYLFNKCMQGLANAEEQSEFAGWLADPENEFESRQLIGRAFHEDKPLEDMPSETTGAILKAILESGRQEPAIFPLAPRRSPGRWWAAAAAVFVLSLGCYWFFSPKPKKTIASVNTQLLKNDVAPGNNKAILTLANGSKILLDNAETGTLARQGNTRIVKTDSARISYAAVREKPSAIIYNTLSTPRGGQYQLTLADGTKVWLNAASSITFPTAFMGNERRVTITGEVYFEVARDAAKPFVVNAAEEELHILGTHFNVNAYDDEGSIRTTLLEGSLKVTATGSQQSALMKPGEQCQVSKTHLSMVDDVNTDEVVAWKDGLFHFESAELNTVMLQFARWYDIEVVYRGTVPQDKFFVIMKRSSSLGSVLKALQASGIKFHIEGRKLIVQPE